MAVPVVVATVFCLPVNAVSTYVLVVASLLFVGVPRLVRLCAPMFSVPLIVPPALGKAALAVVWAVAAFETAVFAVDCAALAADEAAETPVST